MESGNGYYLYIGNISFIAQNVQCINECIRTLYVNIKTRTTYIQGKSKVDILKLPSSSSRSCDLGA